MASSTQSGNGWSRSPARYLMWGMAAFLLALPALAMQFTAEVDWAPGDFLVMGAMLATACVVVEIGARASAQLSYRLAVGLAVVAGFLLIWMNLAVGIIGAEENPANLMFAAVIAAAAGGALVARGKAAALAGAMVVAAIAQFAVAAIALAGDMGAGEPVWPVGFAFLMLFYILMWLASAGLFRAAARAT